MYTHKLETTPAETSYVTELSQRIREEVLTAPSVVYFSDLAHALSGDVKESEHPVSTAFLGAIAIGTQAVDRLRIGSALTANAAIDTYESTQSIPQATAASVATFMVFNTFVGEALNESLDRYPQSVAAFKEKFPSVVNAFESSLPGMKKTDVEAEEKKTLRERISLAVRRAGAGIYLGSTAFVATGAAQERPKKERRKINLRVSRDAGGILLAPFVAAVLKGTVWLAENEHPELAQDITNWASDSKFWLAIGGASMALEYAANKSKENSPTKELIHE